MKFETNSGRWIVLDKIDSTNAFALSNKALPSGSVIIAYEQTAGRGRMGRSWLSIPGNSFLFTGILDIDISEFHMDRMRYLPLAAGLAVIKASESLLDGTGSSHSKELSLKWPNDVYLTDGGRTGKLAGILIETEQNGAELLRCVVGVGVNWRGRVPSPGDESIEPVSLFSETNRDVMEFSLPFINSFNALFEDLMLSGEFSLLKEIRSYFYLKDKIVSLSDGSYRVAGLSEDGGLSLVSLKDGKERILYDTHEKIIVENIQKGIL